MSKTVSSLYLHFPFCRHLCNYCDFYKKVPTDRTNDLAGFHDYMEAAAIHHESLMKTNGCSWAPLKTLYIGGGTPSLWGAEGAPFLSNLLKKHNITLASDCEFTLEVNPGSWDKKSLEMWESLGVNRYSLGIQSLQKEAIKYLDRVHSIEDVYETLEFFKNKKANFSMDFMLGLPYSKEMKRDVIAELKKSLEYNPSHFSVYILTVKDNYTHYNNLPDEEWIEQEYMLVADFLKSEGFIHYEVSNFARPGLESQHNLGYWKSNSVAAIGPSATGFLQETKFRYKWKTKEASIEGETLSEEAFRLEKVYMALRSYEGVDAGFFNDAKTFSELSEKWVKNSLAFNDLDGKVKLTSKGYLLLDSLMNDLFSLKLL